MSKTWKVAGINFAHMHMGDNLRLALAHPQVELVGIADRDRNSMRPAQEALGISDDLVYTDEQQLLQEKRPDVVLLCPPTAEHAEWVEHVAPAGAHLLVEKPFAASVREADRMIEAANAAGVRLAINWPMRWYPSHVTAHRLVSEGAIGDVIEVHYYDGNRGPLYHGADKIEMEPTSERKASSWFYHRDKGGGSLLDYLGYGTTLGTWFNGGQVPIEVTAVVDEPAGLEVDEHSVTVVRYKSGLSKFETRWGTINDPWVHQPLPKCGFVIVGTDGAISSYDFEPTVRLQERAGGAGVDVPVDELSPPQQDPIQYFLHCLETGEPIEGPLSPEVSRVGQLIVDAAVQSANEKRTVKVGS